MVYWHARVKLLKFLLAVTLGAAHIARIGKVRLDAAGVPIDLKRIKAVINNLALRVFFKIKQQLNIANPANKGIAEGHRFFAVRIALVAQPVSAFRKHFCLLAVAYRAREKLNLLPPIDLATDYRVNNRPNAVEHRRRLVIAFQLVFCVAVILMARNKAEVFARILTPLRPFFIKRLIPALKLGKQLGAA